MIIGGDLLSHRHSLTTAIVHAIELARYWLIC
jgi:hypothetical protein